MCKSGMFFLFDRKEFDVCICVNQKKCDFYFFWMENDSY